MKSKQEQFSFRAVREWIRDLAFLAGLVVLGAAIHHQPEYLSSLRAALIAKYVLLIVAFLYGASASIDFWRFGIAVHLPKGRWSSIGALVGTLVLTLAIEMLVFAAADFGDNSARMGMLGQAVTSPGS